MLLLLLRKLRLKSAPSPGFAPPRTAATSFPSTTSVPAPVPKPRRAGAEPARPAATVPATAAWLEKMLALRCAELREEAADSAHALAFIESIERPATVSIRQPPLAAQRALAATRQRDGSTGLIVKLVEEDPTLAQALLRLTNSAMYSRSGGPCASIADAVRRVGSGGVESVVLRCMVEGLLCRPGGLYQPMVDLAWAHMVRSAPIGRALAPIFSMSDDVSFSLALLHDVGKLVIFDHVSTVRSSLRRDPVFPRHFISAALRLLHEPLGGIAALEWGLGAPAAAAIASHHRDDDVPFADDASQLLYVAERTDIARLRQEPVSTRVWTVGGRLSVEAGEIEAVLSALPDDADAAPRIVLSR